MALLSPPLCEPSRLLGQDSWRQQELGPGPLRSHGDIEPDARFLRDGIPLERHTLRDPKTKTRDATLALRGPRAPHREDHSPHTGFGPWGGVAAGDRVVSPCDLWGARDFFPHFHLGSLS